MYTVVVNIFIQVNGRTRPPLLQSKVRDILVKCKVQEQFQSTMQCKVEPSVSIQYSITNSSKMQEGHILVKCKVEPILVKCNIGTTQVKFKRGTVLCARQEHLKSGERQELLQSIVRYVETAQVKCKIGKILAEPSVGVGGETHLRRNKCADWTNSKEF